MPASSGKQTKAEAGYTMSGHGKRCNGCSFWLGNNTCIIVEGRVNPNGTCKSWVKQ